MKQEPLRSTLAYIEWFPSTSWLIFMVLPLIAQLPSLDLWSTRVQFFIVIGCAIGFLLSDLFAFRKPYSDNPRSFQTVSNILMAIIFTSIMCVTTATHLALMPKIPLLLAWDLSSSESLTGEVAKARAEATKLLSYGSWIDYICTWSLVIFAPLSILLWYKLKHYWTALLSFLWISFYAVSTTAKFPLVICTASILLCLCSALPFLNRQIQRLVIACILLIFVVVAILAYTSSPMFNPNSVFLPSSVAIANNDPRTHITIADKHRIWSAAPNEKRQKVTPIVAKTEALIYRIIFGPSDVSIRWYQYFTTVKPPLGFASTIFRPPPENRPSRLVANWAYVERFPSLYLSFANANASFDADAYSRAGGLGAALAMCLILAARLCLMTLRCVGTFGLSLYCIGIVLLSLLPFQSSLQAILFVYGLWMIIGFALLLKIFPNIGGFFNLLPRKKL